MGSMPRLRASIPSDQNHTGRSFGGEELTLLRRVLESGTLNCTKGTVVKQLESEWAARLGVEYCTAVTSGTAAVHCAVAAVNPEPGDEIISSPITDMGAIAPILFQTAVPIFADVDPETYNITAETIACKITPRTRAIIVTHLFGNPCDMDPIMALAREHDLTVIEDCAQAYLASYKGRLVGTVGDIGCFSLQQGKHITTGEGGLVVTNTSHFGRHMRLFHDKAWGYGDSEPDHYFLGPNYRMTELQGAVALAQLKKLDDFVARRVEVATLLSDALRWLPGIYPPKTVSGSAHVYWRYPIHVESDEAGLSLDALTAELKDAGIAASPRYIQKPAFECQVLRDQVTFGSSRFPYEGTGRDEPVVYDPADYPGTYEALAKILVLGWNEKIDEDVAEYIADVLTDAVGSATHAA